MRKLRATTLLFAVIGLMALAVAPVALSRGYTTATLDRNLRSILFELELEMSNALENKIDKVLGRDNFWLSLSLTVNRQKLKSDFANLLAEHERKGTPKRGNKKYNELPGLPIGKNGVPVIQDEGQSVVVLGDGPELTRSFVLSYVSEVSIEVAIDKENERKAQNTLRKLVVEYFKELAIPIHFKFNRKKIAGLYEVDTEPGTEAGAKAKAEESTVKSSDVKLDTRGLAQDMSKIVVRDFFDTIDVRYGKVMLFSAIALLFSLIGGVVLLMISSLRQSKEQKQTLQSLVKGLGDALQGLSFGSNSAGVSSLKSNEGQQHQDINSDNEQEMMLSIRELLNKSPATAVTLLKFFFREGMFEDCLLMLQCLGPQHLAHAKKEIPEENFTDFILDVRDNGTRYFSRERRSSGLHNLYSKVWQASFNLTNMLCQELRAKLSTYDKDQSLQLFSQCNLEETAAVLEMIRPEVMAQILSEGRITPETLGRLPVPGMGRDLLKTILDKVSDIGVKSDQSTSYMERIAQYLPVDLQKKLYSSAGIPAGFQLEDLARDYQEPFIQEISVLSLDQLTSLLGVSTPELRQQILSVLPEIKARRLEQRKLDVSAAGLSLKFELEEKLKRFHSPAKWNEYHRFMKQKNDEKRRTQRQDILKNERQITDKAA